MEGDSDLKAAEELNVIAEIQGSSEPRVVGLAAGSNPTVERKRQRQAKLRVINAAKRHRFSGNYSSNKRVAGWLKQSRNPNR